MLRSIGKQSAGNPWSQFRRKKGRLRLVGSAGKEGSKHGMKEWGGDGIYTHIHLMALFPGLPRWASTRKVKPIWILVEQETVSGSGISWAICKSAPRSRQITTPVPHHSIFYRPDALPAALPTASKHWRHSAGCTSIAQTSTFETVCTACCWIPDRISAEQLKMPH